MQLLGKIELSWKHDGLAHSSTKPAEMTGETITSSATDLASPLETIPAGQPPLNSLRLFRLVEV